MCVCMYVHIYMYATILLYIYLYRYSTLQQNINEYHMFKQLHHNTTSVFTGWQLDYDP